MQRCYHQHGPLVAHVLHHQHEVDGVQADAAHPRHHAQQTVAVAAPSTAAKSSTKCS